MSAYILLLDTSGSMYGEAGEKILGLNCAVSNFVDGLKTIAPEPQLAIVTFGGPPSVQDFIPAGLVSLKTYEAKGSGYFDDALEIAASLSGSADVVAIVLMSDGALPFYDYSKIPEGYPLYAVAIGIDADYDQLERFTDNPDTVLPPYAANDLAGFALTRNHVSVDFSKFHQKE